MKKPGMKRLRTMADRAETAVVGINRRNIDFIYPNNPREAFSIANDKAWTKRILAAGGVPVPDNYAVISHQWKIEEELLKLGQRDSLVVKPARGSGGNGILILERQNGAWRTPDGSEYDRGKLALHMAGILYGAYSHDQADQVIVEERLVPHPFFSEIYRRGIPDIRIIVFREKPVMAMLRIPTRRSRGKANLHQGAIGIGIGMDSGRLGFGIHQNRRIAEHPDSQAVFRGMEIPHWERMVRISRSAAAMVPLKFIGVDIILDENRGPLVIEINARPGLQIQNANEMGLLEALNGNQEHDQTPL